MGGTFSAKLVTRAYLFNMFGAGPIFESIFETQMLLVLRSRSVEVGKGGRSAAKAEPSGGGGGKPPELLQVPYQQFSTPCYLCRGAADSK